MKKRLIIILLLLTVFLAFPLVKANEISETGIPYDTFTLHTGRLTKTQTAYIPLGNVADFTLNNPQDIFIKNQKIYVANTGDKNIIVSDIDGNLISKLEYQDFVEPTGVYVDNEENIFVADAKAQAVFKFDSNSNLLLKIERPTIPLFGSEERAPYKPTKVAVGIDTNIYVIGEGSTNGVMEFDKDGSFVGYIGINQASFSIRKYIYNFFVKDSDLAANKAPAPINVATGSQGSIYTANRNVSETFKRLNISGINTLSSGTYYPGEVITDIYVSDTNYVYIVTEDASIYEYDYRGNLLFAFFSKSVSSSKPLGMLDKPTGITVDEQGNIYVLDSSSQRAAIEVYQKTAFVELVHQAVDLYNDGKYIEGQELWEKIIVENTRFSLAHTARGEALFKQDKFDEALEEFYIARDYNGYSNAYWEIRNKQIQNNLGKWTIILVSIIVLYKILMFVLRKTGVSKKISSTLSKVRKVKIINELVYSVGMMKRPADVLYGVKREKKASYLSGLIVLLLFVLVFVVNAFGTGFLFRNTLNSNRVVLNLLIVLVFFFLFVIVNYLVSAISDGEGKFRDVFIASAYSLMPYILLTLPMTLISHVLTYNEIFIYNAYNYVVLGWCFILFFVSTYNIHNYSFFTTVKNIIFTAFGMIIIALLGFLVYMFAGQAIDFIVSVIKEVVFRA